MRLVEDVPMDESGKEEPSASVSEPVREEAGSAEATCAQKKGEAGVRRGYGEEVLYWARSFALARRRVAAAPLLCLYLTRAWHLFCA
jgi:hypothetical protein